MPASTSGSTSTYGRWMALLAALLGWLFDGAEMGIFPMVGRAAIQDMLGIVGKPSPEQEQVIALNFGIIMAFFLVGAAAGGVLFGWLGDRIGRVRAMSLSVLTYAVFTGLCGLTQTPLQLGILRFIASLGMGGEWALGVALVMEVWPNRSRALMAGLIGASANVGYMSVGFIGLALANLLVEAESLLTKIGLSESTVQMLVANGGWRLMLILGTLPALLTFVIRVFVPESERWIEEKERGHTSHWASVDLFGVLLGSFGPGLIIYLWATPNTPTIVRIFGTILGLGIAIIGYTYPVYRYLGRMNASEPSGNQSPWPTLRRMFIGATLSGVALLGTWGSAQWAATWASQLGQNQTEFQNAKEWTQVWLSFGAIVGTVLAALAGNWFGRRFSYALLCVMSILAILYFYQMHSKYGTPFLVAAFALGVCTSSFYGWLPLYLPELFATKVRATGQGFAFNFGRIIAAIGTLQVAALLPLFGNISTYSNVQGGYPVACSFVCAIYLLGIIIIPFAPETRGQALPE